MRGCGRVERPAFPAPSLSGRNIHAQLGRIASRERGGVAVKQLTRESAVVMAGLVPAIHVFLAVTKPGRGSPGQAR